MNKYKIIILAAIATIGMSSCNGYLDEENLSNVNADKYFEEKDGFESLANGAYASLRTVWANEPWLFNLGVDIYTRGESYEVGGSYENRDVYSSELNEYGTLDAENSFVSSFYSNVYYGIQVCNTAINKASGASGMTESSVSQRVAEMRFLRAYYYYLLVEQFGDVAIVTNEINSPQTAFTRIPEKDVYEFIISELKAVVNVLPASQKDFGRATQGAAKHLLGLVYLTHGYKSYGESSDFSRAASLFDEVIKGGQYALQATYGGVYDPNNQTNNEIILSVQYDAKSLGSMYGGNSQQYLYGFLLDKKVPTGFERYSTAYGYHDNQFMPTQFLYSLYNTAADSRYDVTFTSSYYATVANERIGLEVGDLRVYFPKYDQVFTTADSLAVMAGNPNAIIVTRDRWKQDIEHIGGSGMCPMITKYHNPTDDPTGDDRLKKSTRDIFLFRLADTYLLAAEAYYKAGDNAKAADRINAVRQRAALPGHVGEMRIQSSDVTIDFILDERAREMAGEYNRWMDLKRTGKLIERTLAHNNLAARANKMDDHILVRPIPQSVMDQTTGGNFKQNTGY